MEVDYLIIGQGIAGTVLSYQLLKAKKKVLVLNNTNPHASSNVAAGLYNPITGRRMVKTWQADVLFPYLVPFYQEMGTVLESQILYPKNVYRPFFSVAEQNDWMAKGEDPAFKNYVAGIFPHTKHKGVKDPFGGLELKYGGHLEVASMLEKYRQYLLSKNAYIEEIFAERLLQIQNSGVIYKGIRAKKIIFCTGAESSHGMFFDWLPFKLVKGDIISIKPSIFFDKIINRGVYVLPLTKGICKVGSTYNWDDLSHIPTEQGKAELVRKVEELLDIPYDIIEHKAGVRPATDDRRPLIGQHPEFKPLYIFNGLGTKGVSIAPYFSEQFLQFLEGKKELDDEVNINRYISLYYNYKTAGSIPCQ